MRIKGFSIFSIFIILLQLRVEEDIASRHQKRHKITKIAKSQKVNTNENRR